MLSMPRCTLHSPLAVRHEQSFGSTLYLKMECTRTRAHTHNANKQSGLAVLTITAATKVLKMASEANEESYSECMLTYVAGAHRN